MKKLVAIALFSLSACATASVINKISLGMTKPEVLKVMGNPVSVSAHGDTEYLNYRLKETDAYDFRWPYFVRLVNGKVDAYGRTGDFNTTKNNTLDINVNK